MYTGNEDMAQFYYRAFFFSLHTKLNACFKINTYFRNKVSHKIHDMRLKKQNKL